MSLSHDDVERLLKLLEASSFDELQLETEGVKLMLRRRGAAPGPAWGSNTVSTPTAASTPDSPPTAPAASDTAAAPASTPAQGDGLVELRSPMLGSFFRSPQPGATPFVDVGSRVAADTTVGIIEVMKLMNPVTADVAGEVVDVCVRDGELVEFGQVLVRIRPLP